jgi:hypothetical protein
VIYERLRLKADLGRPWGFTSAARFPCAAGVNNVQQLRQGALDQGMNVSEFWITPVKSSDLWSAQEMIRELVGTRGIYAFGEKTHARKHMKAGDWICFYMSKKGVVGHAKITSSPRKATPEEFDLANQYPWVVRLELSSVYFDNPVIFDLTLRSRSEALGKRVLTTRWSWLVQVTRRISQSDFNLFTRSQ